MQWAYPLYKVASRVRTSGLVPLLGVVSTLFLFRFQEL